MIQIKHVRWILILTLLTCEQKIPVEKKVSKIESISNNHSFTYFSQPTGLENLFFESIPDDFPYTIDTIKDDNIQQYVLDGDLQVDRTTLRRLLKTTATVSFIRPKSLHVEKSVFNQPILWNRSKPVRFGVYYHSFLQPSDYKLIVKAAIEAASEWSKVCGLTFVYDKSFDLVTDYKSKKYPPRGFGFMILKRYLPNGYIAQAFLPDSTTPHVIVVTNKLLEDSSLAKGVMTHEFGHVMGFLHETSNLPDGTCGHRSLDRNTTISYGDADHLTIMHFFCQNENGKTYGTRNLTISKIDSTAAAFFYPK